MRRNIIVHSTGRVSGESNIAVEFRPARMVNAFEDLGYNVTLIAGDKSSRAKAITEIKDNIEAGNSYDFVYAENTFKPMMINRYSAGLEVTPALDRNFFRHMKKKHVPIGIFYRDALWTRKGYLSSWGPVVEKLARVLYRNDLKFYSRYVDRIFVPDEAFVALLPNTDKSEFDTLPPACENVVEPSLVSKSPITFIYVGSFTGQYEADLLFEYFSKNKAYNLIICIRRDEWELIRKKYQDFITENIRILHKNSRELEQIYKEADIGLFYVKPIEYMKSTIPVKIFEYVANGLPFIATSETPAATFAISNGVGWAVDYDVESFSRQVESIESSPGMLRERKIKTTEVAKENTWISRAEKVRDLLLS